MTTSLSVTGYRVYAGPHEVDETTGGVVMALEQAGPAAPHAHGPVPAQDGSLDAPLDAAQLLQVTMDVSLDPHVYLRAVRDASGAIVDFVATQPNLQACKYLQRERSELDGARLLDILPRMAGSGLVEGFVATVETGVPLVVDDIRYADSPLGEEHRYELRGVRVGDGLSFTWRDVTERFLAAQELARSEQRFRTALEASAAGMATTDLERRFTQVNPALCRMLGRDAGWLLEHHVTDVVHPEDISADRELREKLLVGAFPSATHEKRLVRADGQVLWVQHAIALIRDEQGRPESYVSQFFDVTESRRTGILIEAATEAIVDPFAIWAVSTEGPHGTRLLRANPAMRGILLGTRQTLVGRSLSEIFPPPLDPIADSLQADLVAAVRGNAPFVAADQTGLNTPDGAVPRMWRPTLSPIGEGLVAVMFRDVTDEVQESRRLAQELERANEEASRDPLTGLYNRRALMALLTAMLSHPPRAGTRMAVLFGDIDGLKDVNDTLGHAVGDHVIVQVARRLQRSVRIDDTVARLGGDEFVVVLTSLGRERDAVEVARNLCNAVAEPIEVDGAEVQVTLSVGVALASPREDPATLLAHADRALYRAKASGKARAELAAPSDTWVI